MTLFISIITLLLIGVILMAIKDNKNNTLSWEELKRLQQAYETALQGKDRKEALKAGRTYYSIQRKGGNLTAHDEQVIANDLNTMPLEVFFRGQVTDSLLDSTTPYPISSH
ncbi:MAG: hypothetical protein ABW007_12955 [Chitinophagaceae bacterium]